MGGGAIANFTVTAGRLLKGDPVSEADLASIYNALGPMRQPAVLWAANRAMQEIAPADLKAVRELAEASPRTDSVAAELEELLGEAFAPVSDAFSVMSLRIFGDRSLVLACDALGYLANAAVGPLLNRTIATRALLRQIGAHPCCRPNQKTLLLGGLLQTYLGATPVSPGAFPPGSPLGQFASAASKLLRGDNVPDPDLAQIYEAMGSPTRQAAALWLAHRAMQELAPADLQDIREMAAVEPRTEDVEADLDDLIGEAFAPVADAFATTGLRMLGDRALMIACDAMGYMAVAAVGPCLTRMTACRPIAHQLCGHPFLEEGQDRLVIGGLSQTYLYFPVRRSSE